MGYHITNMYISKQLFVHSTLFYQYTEIKMYVLLLFEICHSLGVVIYICWQHGNGNRPLDLWYKVSQPWKKRIYICLYNFLCTYTDTKMVAITTEIVITKQRLLIA